MRHSFHPEAVLEFEEAVQFYKQRGHNLALRFTKEIRATIAKIIATPDRWRILEDDVRRCLVHVFPMLSFTIERDYIFVVVVIHGKRQPGYWPHRLSKHR